MPNIIAIGRVAASIGAVAFITYLYSELLHANPTTVALSYLIAILLIATTWGIVEATTASVVAVLGFNFFFLPPVGTLTIADPQNWVAFVAFLVTAIVASQLSGRARQREFDAAGRQRDLERLYGLSRALLLSEGGAAVSGAIARHVAESFELKAVGLYDQRADAVWWAGATEVPAIETKLREVARRGTLLRDPAGLVVIAIQLGGTPIGSIAMMDVGLSDTVLHSIANLAAIGLERARSQDATARAEAAQQSSELRATVLDALAHEFKTPLTSMKAAASDLLASASTSARDRELVSIIDEDLDRFQALVTDAVRMLRIDAGDFAVHFDRHNLSDVVATTRAEIRDASRRSPASPQQVPENLTVDADHELLGSRASTAARQRAQVFAADIAHRNSRARQWSASRSSSAIRVRPFRSASRRGWSSVSTGVRRRGTFPEPGWGSRSFSRSRERTVGAWRFRVHQTVAPPSRYRSRAEAPSRERRPDSRG